MHPILQSESSECALACLAMVARAHGLQLDLSDLRRRFPISLKGATLQQLMAQADALHFSSRPLRLELEELPQLALPCILHWDLNHFVVLQKVGRTHVVVLDPAVGQRRLSLAEVSRHFTGVVLELTPNAAFTPADQRQRVALSALTGRVLGLKRSLLQILAVAVVLELLAITAPLLNQWVVDDAIATNDAELLTVLVVGFSLLLLIQTGVGLARSWMVMVLGQSLSLQWASNVFAHLVKLPVEYFEKRHLGDVVSRFGSVGAIQKTLTTSVVEAVLDGVMALAALGMMLLYSPMLSAVVVGAVLLYGLLRWVAYGPLRDAAAERLMVAAREQSHFLETLRAITPLKLFGREQERRARWQNLLVEVQNRDVHPNEERTHACAQLAAVHEDIARMPMGYQTLVGDMGSSLSGGQKQRVLLARALYKNPKVLALDEATSHLDVANEQRVTQALAQLALTRIIVAHRPETIAGAQRVVALQQGRVQEAVHLRHETPHGFSTQAALRTGALDRPTD